MPESPGDDLAAMLVRLTRLLTEQESPILHRHDLSMWEYVVLSSLAGAHGMSQAELAQRSGRDTTRLIVHLDDLERRGFITRDVDPADRRRRIVQLTPAGQSTFRTTRDEIRSMERDFVARAGGSLEHLRRTLEEVLGGARRQGNETDTNVSP